MRAIHETERGVTMRIRRFLFLITLAAAAGSAGSTTNAAAPSVLNFSGVWAHPSIPGFEPLASGPTALVNRSRRGITSDNRQLVGDYTNPILKPEAAATVKRLGEISLAGIGYPTPRNQCWPGGVPFVFTTTSIEILQGRNEITILYFEDHEVRHVRMNQQHPANVKPSWYGDSVGHFEGDTLVVDTVGIKVGPHSMVDSFGTPFSEALHLTERYRLIDYEAGLAAAERSERESRRLAPDNIAAGNGVAIDANDRGKALQVEFKVEDPNVFTTPWSAISTYWHASAEWAERVCAENVEGYYAGLNTAVPMADRPDF